MSKENKDPAPLKRVRVSLTFTLPLRPHSALLVLLASTMTIPTPALSALVAALDSIHQRKRLHAVRVQQATSTMIVILLRHATPRSHCVPWVSSPTFPPMHVSHACLGVLIWTRTQQRHVKIAPLGHMHM